MCSVLSHQALTSREEVSAEEAVEINHHHDIHYHHSKEEASTMVQPGVIVDDVPGEVELCAQAKCDVGQNINEFVDVVKG